jgi:phosphatidylglycerophosphatase A
VHLIAFGFGSGCAPKMPGTVGTLAAVPCFLLLSLLPLPAYLILLLLAFMAGIWVCQKTSRALGVHDHGGIVWDEFVGFWLTMVAVPVSWQSVLAGFLLFRLFDIWKPWPIRWLDRSVSGGFGIMIDDVLAGLYALTLLHIAVGLGWLA